MSNLPMCEDIFDEDGRMKTDETDWETAEDNSDTLGDHGGVLFNVEGGDGGGWHVSINRVNLDQQILKRTEALYACHCYVIVMPLLCRSNAMQ